MVSSTTTASLPPGSDRSRAGRPRSRAAAGPGRRRGGGAAPGGGGEPPPRALDVAWGEHQAQVGELAPEDGVRVEKGPLLALVRGPADPDPLSAQAQGRAKALVHLVG